MNSELKKEYDFHLTKFYNDYFKYKSGKKSSLFCSGCSSKKRFIFDLENNKIIYSCGPNKTDNKKCGPQYTIELPKYIQFKELQCQESNITGWITNWHE